MAEVINFYVDDSGARHPGRPENQTWNANCHWFALGGILLAESDEEEARSRIKKFRERWPQIEEAPLHSYEIRNLRDNFWWLKTGSVQQRQHFFADLSETIIGLPILGLACVIDGPGYNLRYGEMYRDQRWMMCKTAFVIIAERASKHAMARDAKLRILVEQSAKKAEDDLKGYYEDLKVNGHPFDSSRAGAYAPLTGADYAAILYEFRVKQKTSPMMQVADLVLWPLCRGGYDNEYAPYSQLRAGGKLLDALYPGNEAARGTKYSCFEFWLAEQQKSKAPHSAGLCRPPYLG